MKKTINLIQWQTNSRFYGLDYSTRFGVYKDFTFDIRYNYCGKPNIEPPINCGLWLTIYFKHAKIESIHSASEVGLMEESEKYLELFLINYKDSTALLQ